jgi:hypothetical protein
MRFSTMHYTFLFLEPVLTLLYLQMLTIEVIIVLNLDFPMKCPQTWFIVQTKPIHILQAHTNLKSRN